MMRWERHTPDVVIPKSAILWPDGSISGDTVLIDVAEVEIASRSGGEHRFSTGASMGLCTV